MMHTGVVALLLMMVVACTASQDTGRTEPLPSYENLTVAEPVGLGQRENAHALAVDESRNTVYAARPKSDGRTDIVVVDTLKDKQTGVIELDSELLDMALDSSHHSLYVTDTLRRTIVPGEQPSIRVINTKVNEVVEDIELSSWPQNIVVDEEAHSAYITTLVEGLVWVVDTTSNEITSTIEVGNGPSSIALAPSGKAAYVTNFYDGTVSVIDTATNEVSATIAVGEWPMRISINENTNTAYVTHTVSNTAHLARPDNPDYVFHADDHPQNGRVSVVDITAEEVATTITLDGVLRGIAVHPPSGTAYVARTDFDGAAVIVIDTTTNEVVGTVAVEGRPEEVQVDQDSQTVYVTGDHASRFDIP